MPVDVVEKPVNLPLKQFSLCSMLVVNLVVMIAPIKFRAGYMGLVPQLLTLLASGLKLMSINAELNTLFVLKMVEKRLATLRLLVKTKKSGSIVTFKPDSTIFLETQVFSFQTISDRLKQMAFLNRGIKIRVEDKRGEEPKVIDYYYEGGIKEYVIDLNKNKKPTIPQVIYCEGRGS